MTIVAHQDDDLLFTNPDLQRNIDAKDCVRTIYITAGDGGMGEYYWTSREKGAIAAYSAMAQTSAENWSQKTVKIAPNAWVTIASPRNNRNISLIFMRLPDGGLQNEGFADSAFSTLTRLHDGSIDSITTKDGQSTYKNVELKNALVTLMNYYKPDEIRTQSTHNSNNLPDHADHIATSLYAQESRDTYVSIATAAKSVALKTYLGYPVRENEENIFEVDREKKLAAFLAYAQQDSAVCGTIESCLNTPTYGQYLTRQYAQVL
jgi:LmbE family N-acetylglucosaminyl deacetylase